MEVSVPRVNPADPVLPHQDRRVNVVEQIAP